MIVANVVVLANRKVLVFTNAEESSILKDVIDCLVRARNKLYIDPLVTILTNEQRN